MPTCGRRGGAARSRCALHLFIAFGLASVLSLTTRSVHAEEPFVIPVSPMHAPPRSVFEFHYGFSVPLRTTSLCPSGSGCVLGGGGGIGASFEQRMPSGLGGVLGYDAWFLDSDSVFELAVQQLLRGGLRFVMPTDTVLHPVFELSGGVMVFGDTFDIATVGLAVQGFGGAEIELTETFGLLVGVGMRAFTHTEFRTDRDRVVRGKDGLTSESAHVQLGLTVMM